jgi:hypothetical protein
MFAAKISLVRENIPISYSAIRIQALYGKIIFKVRATFQEMAAT